MLRRFAISIVTAAAVATLTGLPGTPSTGAAMAYTATAAADGLRSTVVAADSPGTDTPIDGGGPSAQAIVTSTGTSRAFASLPYPGEMAVTLPGLLAAVGVAGVPPYPAYAASDHPIAPDASREAPGYRLHARSEATASAAEAVAGDPGTGLPTATSTARVAPGPDGGVVAVAESMVRNLRFGDLVIGEARATSSASADADGRLKRQGSFEMAGFTIGGRGVTIGPDGVRVDDRRADPGPAGPHVQALAEHGIKLEYLAPVETPHGIVSAGVRITLVRPASTGGTGTWTLTLGRASAGIDASADPAPGLLTAPPVPAGTAPSSDEGVPPAAPAPGAASADEPTASPSGRPARLAALSPAAGGTTPPISPGEIAIAGGQAGSSAPPAVTAPGGDVPVGLTAPVLARGSLYDASRAFPAIVLIAGIVYAALGAVTRTKVEG